MLGLFATLNLGTRSLQAQQTAVEITGQNLANVNNSAYSRQRAVLQTSTAVSTPIGPQGTGVQIAAIQQYRDALLDGQIRDESSVGSYWGSQQSALQNTQTALDEFLNDSASTVNGAADAGAAASTQGLADQLTQLFNGFQGVATSPASLAQRQSLVSQAQILTGSFNQIASRLTAANGNLNTSVSNDVNSASQLLSDVAGLNQEITTAESPGGAAANDLRDLREQKLEALAKLVNFQASTAPDGTLSLSVGGVTLVSGSQVVDTLQAYDAGGGQLQVRTANGGMALALSGGSIAGAIDARDGALAGLRQGLDSLASTLITTVNSVYKNGYDLNGNTGANFFTGTNAATIGVNSALQNDPSLVQAAGAAGATGDNTVALAVARLASQGNATLNNQTFHGAYGQLVVSLGNSLAGASDQVANHQALNSMLLARRDSVSGVSLDEEMANLISFQKAYQASARIVSTVDQMLDTIINMKGA